KGVSTFVNYKPDTTDATSGSKQQQQSSQTSDSDQQQTKQTSGPEQQELQSRKLAVQTSDLEKEWQQTTGNFGGGKLD
ncbi:hypothetical protein PI124_g21310, partial [Phytophthora idaei]